jgi:hypothetical protein
MGEIEREDRRFLAVRAESQSDVAETLAKPQLILMCVGEHMLLGCCSPRSRYHCKADLGVWRQKTLLLAILEFELSFRHCGPGEAEV